MQKNIIYSLLCIYGKVLLVNLRDNKIDLFMGIR